MDLRAGAEERVRQLAAAVQRELSVATGAEAMALFQASERVREDCAYAVEPTATTHAIWTVLKAGETVYVEVDRS